MFIMQRVNAASIKAFFPELPMYSWGFAMIHYFRKAASSGCEYARLATPCSAVGKYEQLTKLQQSPGHDENLQARTQFSVA